ncbi:FG-GAP repeat domain-containing protein [Polymorphospora rubra]|uniref:FG-GAP repeat domain-containing protein n=1 Tax=Polymorphospora rubra TaxID=338584 RepID=UPI001BB39DBA|nr:VCBS repeat-containing protein [Polymorphospora rubra]
MSATSGSTALTVLSGSELVHGVTYHWRVRATDSGGLSSAWSETCSFTLDRTLPDEDVTITSVQYPDYNPGGAVSTVPAGTPGQFTISADGDTEVVGFYYGIDNDQPSRYVAADVPGGSATVTLTPVRSGPGILHVRTFDGVNRSGEVDDDYRWFATAPAGPHGSRGEVNADGTTDIIGRTLGGHLCLHLGDGAGGFLDGNKCSLMIDYWRNGLLHLVRPGDWDGDGWNDLVAVQADGDLVYFAGRGTGSFEASATEVPSGWDPDGIPVPTTNWDGYDLVVAPGDWDGDGAPDLITRDAVGEVVVHRGNGFGGWADPPTTISLGTGIWDDFDTVLAPGDLDGDGHLDLLARKPAGELVLLSGAATGTPAAGVQIGTGWDTYRLLFAPGDFDGDDSPDVMGVDAAGNLLVFYGDPTAPGYFGNPGGTTIDTGWNAFDKAF